MQGTARFGEYCLAAMKSHLASPRLAVGTVTLLVWALAAGSALYWGLRASSAQGQAVPPVAGAGQAIAVDTAAVARALGAKGSTIGASAAPDVVSRLSLRGVVTHDGRGAALIAVSDKPAKPFRVGAEVESGWTVKSVSPRSIVITSGEREATLQMPAMSARSDAGDAVAAAPGAMPSRASFTSGRPVVPQIPPSTPSSSRD